MKTLAYPTSFVLDDQGYRSSVLFCLESGVGLRYAYQDASGWHTVEVDPVLVGLPTSLALDAGGKPHISYTRTAAFLELRHAYQD